MTYMNALKYLAINCKLQQNQVIHIFGAEAHD